MPLTDTMVRNAKPGQKAIRLKDDRGLYLEVTPAGGKLWRLRYWLNSRENRISLGTYPDVSLKDARERRDEARKLIANGIDRSRIWAMARRSTAWLSVSARAVVAARAKS